MIRPSLFNDKKLLPLKKISYRPLALAITFALSSTTPSLSRAFVYGVDNTNDSGAYSLRAAILEANANPGPDSIIFPISLAGSTINLLSELVITDSVTITGPTSTEDGSGIILDGGGITRHINAGGFTPNSGKYITLENITLTNGHFDGSSFISFGNGGGSIFIEDADLTLNNCVISGNTTSGGQFGHGGGVFAKDSNVTLNKTTISDNSTSAIYGHGGGLFFFNTNTEIIKDVNILHSTISGNSTSGERSSGGGVLVNQLNFEVSQSTISGNSTSGSNAYGGGIVIGGHQLSTLKQSTVTDNSSVLGAGGISTAHSTNEKLTLVNSILSGNSGPEGNLGKNFPNFIVNLYALNSLFGDSVKEVTGVNINNTFSNLPDLGPLQDNGGETFTQLPNITSPAINAGDNDYITSTTDQRGKGFARILNGTVDIGAVEVSMPTSTHAAIKRAEIVKPILQALYGNAFFPYAATGNEYVDVKADDFNADWIERFKEEGLTEGCAVDKFCPESVVTKDELAKLIVKAKLGPTFNPMPATGIYNDVPIGSFNADWIEALNLEGSAAGCDTGKFCPKDVVTIEVFNNILNAAFP